MKYLLALCIFLLLTGCTQPSFTSSESMLTINNNSKSFDIPIINKKEYKFSHATLNSFVLNEKRFHLEYIKMKSQYTWTGLADGFYQDFLQEKIKNLKVVSHQVVDVADVFLYTKEDKYFYLITLYDGTSNTFIIDYTGDIASKILDDDKNIKKIEQLETSFSESMLENNIIGHYFERNNSDNETIVIP